MQCSSIMLIFMHIFKTYWSFNAELSRSRGPCPVAASQKYYTTLSFALYSLNKTHLALTRLSYISIKQKVEKYKTIECLY